MNPNEPTPPISAVSIERRTDGSITYRVTVGADYSTKLLSTAQKEFKKLRTWVNQVRASEQSELTKAMKKSLDNLKKGS